MPTKAARANDSLVDSFAPFSFRYPRDITWSVLQISKTLRFSEHTVRAIRQREAQDIAERKKSLAAILASVAELGAERMEATIGKASLRDAAIGTGVAVDASGNIVASGWFSGTVDLGGGAVNSGTVSKAGFLAKDAP